MFLFVCLIDLTEFELNLRTMDEQSLRIYCVLEHMKQVSSSSLFFSKFIALQESFSSSSEEEEKEKKKNSFFSSVNTNEH